jgi:vancomycin resistance protein VanW
MTYAISLKKEIIKRHIRNIQNGEHFSKKRSPQSMPAVIASYSGEMIKKGPGIDLQLQLNKAKNIELACSKIDGVVIEPGESFSFWHYVGKTSHGNGLSEGRLIVNGKLISGTGGGLCNLANTLNLSVMYSPLTITEIHHSDTLAPDPDNKYTAGTISLTTDSGTTQTSLYNYCTPGAT